MDESFTTSPLAPGNLQRLPVYSASRVATVTKKPARHTTPLHYSRESKKLYFRRRDASVPGGAVFPETFTSGRELLSAF